jgi:type II secretory pathway component PulF
MPRFAYTARDSAGQAVAAELSAGSRKDALRALAARGLQPLRLEERAENARAPKASARDGAVAGPSAIPRAGYARREFLPFFEALNELTASGMSAGEAVRLLAHRLREARLRALAAAVWERLSEGQPLSLAMEGLPTVFDPQCVSLVRAAEATGNLHEVLERLIVHHRERRELRQKLTTALVYPVFVCLVAFGVIVFFVTFLLPRLQSLLASLGSRLPLPTQILVGSARLLVDYGVILLPLLAFAALALWRWRRTEAGRATLDAWFVQAPLARRFFVDAAVLEFTQTLAVLLENGINTVEALRLTERTVGNRSVRAALRAATDRVLEGDSLSAALARTGYLPPLVTDRIAVGESTGKLAPCLRDISRHYAVTHSRRLHWLTGVISTAVLLFAFAFVAFLAYAIVSAVLQVSAGFKF